RKPLFRGQAERHRPPGLPGRPELAFADQLPDALDGALVHVEVGVHRVHRHDGGEQGAAALVPRQDEVAHRDAVAAHAPADRRGDRRVFQVQPARGHLGWALAAAMLARSTPRAAALLSKSDRDNAPTRSRCRFRWYSASSNFSRASSWRTLASAWFSSAW